MTESSIPNKRAMKKQKVESDMESQHQLWCIRIRELMSMFDISAHHALEKLEEEVAAEIKSRPQWSQTIKLAWANFQRRINNASAS